MVVVVVPRVGAGTWQGAEGTHPGEFGHEAALAAGQVQLPLMQHPVCRSQHLPRHSKDD